jgi:hypothetical protein
VCVRVCVVVMLREGLWKSSVRGGEVVRVFKCMCMREYVREGVFLCVRE